MVEHFNRSLRQSDHRDFVIREHQIKIWQAIGLFVIAFILILTASEVRGHIGGTWAFAVILLAIIALTGWFTVYFVQMNRDMLMASEFQNALFANAAVLNSKFCFIIKNDGMIVYFDPGFQKTFPYFTKQEHRTLDTLFATAGVAREDGDRIIAQIDKGISGKVIFPLRINEREHNIILTIDPLPRPQGYFLVRGREYIEPRSDKLETSHSLMAYAPELLGQILQALPVGVMAADGDGTIRYISHAMAEALGYSEAEIMSGNMSIHALVHQMGARKPGDISTDPFSGDVLLKRKNGELVKTMLTLQPFLDPTGKVVGCSIMAMDNDSANDAVKKKLNNLT